MLVNMSGALRTQHIWVSEQTRRGQLDIPQNWWGQAINLYQNPGRKTQDESELPHSQNSPVDTAEAPS